MSRRIGLLVAAAAGFVVGALVVFTSGFGTSSQRASPAPEPDRVDDVPVSPGSTAVDDLDPPSSGAAADAMVDDAAGPEDRLLVERTLLMWTSGSLATGFAAGLVDLAEVDGVSAVRGGDLALTRVVDASGKEIEAHEDGWHVPIDAIAVDVGMHREFVGPTTRAALTNLGPGRALLSESAASLRGGGVGLVLTFATGSVEVVGVIGDADASGAELMVGLETGSSLGVERERFVLVSYAGDRQALQRGAVDLLDGLGSAAPIRFRSPAETTWLRHGDAVLPSAQIKLRFGEFAIRDADGRMVELDPGWVEANIVETEVPILGTVRCHREAIAPLEAALGELVGRAIPHVVDAEQFAGCFVPRRIGEGLPLSRHAWGIAVDLNVGDNPRGSFATQDPRLVDAMRTAGFGWGGAWLVPDPAHYELIEIR